MTLRLPGGSWPGTAMIAGIGLLLAVVLAACNGGSSKAGTSTGNPNTAALAYARCMRAHGITDFPDPNAQGGFSAPAGVNVNSPQYTAAYGHCKSLDSSPPPPDNPATTAKLLKYAICMRAHAVPWFPDPNAQGHLAVSFPKGTGPNDPQYLAANRACAADLPGNGTGR